MYLFAYVYVLPTGMYEDTGVHVNQSTHVLWHRECVLSRLFGMSAAAVSE